MVELLFFKSEYSSAHKFYIIILCTIAFHYEKYKTKLSIFSTTDNIQRRCEISVTKNIPTNELNYTQNFFQNEQLYILMHDDYEKFAESLNSYINLSLKNL